MQYNTNELEMIGLVWSIHQFKNYLLGSQFKLINDHKAMVTALRDDQNAKTTQSKSTRWADKLLPYDFSLERKPGKDMGFVDYLSRHPTNKPIPHFEDDEKFVIASVSNIGILLGFDKAMPETQVKTDREQFTLDSFQSVETCCNMIGQNHESKTTNEIEEEQLIQHAAEQLRNTHDQSNFYLRRSKLY